MGTVSVTVAPRALLVSLALWERAGVRETIRVATTDIFRGGLGAMIVKRSLGNSSEALNKQSVGRAFFSRAIVENCPRAVILKSAGEFTIPCDKQRRSTSCS